MEVPPVPQYWTQDVTPERLGVLMAENGGRMAVISDEGGIFDILAGRYSKSAAPNLDLFLQGHSGSPMRVDRRSREAVLINTPALTLVLTPQPDVLRSLSEHKAFRGRGLLARFLFTLPPSPVGTRSHDTIPIPAQQNRRRDLEGGFNGIQDKREERIRNITEMGRAYLEDYRLRHKSIVYAEYAVANLSRKQFQQYLSRRIRARLPALNEHVHLDFMRGGVRRASWQGVPMARYGRADERIRRILDGTGFSRGVTRGVAAAILALGSPLVYVAAAAHPEIVSQDSTRAPTAQRVTAASAPSKHAVDGPPGVAAPPKPTVSQRASGPSFRTTYRCEQDCKL